MERHVEGLLRRWHGVEERVEHGNFAIANDDYVQAGVLSKSLVPEGTSPANDWRRRATFERGYRRKLVLDAKLTKALFTDLSTHPCKGSPEA